MNEETINKKDMSARGNQWREHKWKRTWMKKDINETGREWKGRQRREHEW